MQHDREELIDLIREAISDSLDADWRAIDGAEYVLRALEEAGIVKTFVRGTECPSSPTGRHIADTSMESGPNNCFHCEGKM